MLMFVISFVLSFVSFIAFATSLTLWAYTDAKVVSSWHPIFWVLVVFFGCFPLGLIAYLLVGRTNLENTAPNKYKKAFIFSFASMVFAIFFSYLSLLPLGPVNQTEGLFRRSGQFQTFRQEVSEQEWSISARNADGFIWHNFYLYKDDFMS